MVKAEAVVPPAAHRLTDQDRIVFTAPYCTVSGKRNNFAEGVEVANRHMEHKMVHKTNVGYMNDNYHVGLRAINAFENAVAGSVKVRKESQVIRDAKFIEDTRVPEVTAAGFGERCFGTYANKTGSVARKFGAEYVYKTRDGCHLHVNEIRFTTVKKIPLDDVETKEGDRFSVWNSGVRTSIPVMRGGYIAELPIDAYDSDATNEVVDMEDEGVERTDIPDAKCAPVEDACVKVAALPRGKVLDKSLYTSDTDEKDSDSDSDFEVEEVTK